MACTQCFTAGLNAGLSDCKQGPPHRGYACPDWVAAFALAAGQLEPKSACHEQAQSGGKEHADASSGSLRFRGFYFSLSQIWVLAKL